MITLPNTQQTQALATDIMQWSNATFTDQRDALPILHHLHKESKELIEAFQKFSINSHDQEHYKNLEMEFADCFMLILDAASHFQLEVTELESIAHTCVSMAQKNRVNGMLFLMQFNTEYAIKAFRFYKEAASDNTRGLGEYGRTVADVKKFMGTIYFCIVNAANRLDISNNELLQLTRQKLEINKKRKWGKPDANGVVEHVRKKMEPVKVNVEINGNPKEKFQQGGIPFSQLDAKPGVEDFSFQHTQYIIQEQIRRSSEAQTKLIAHKLLEKLGQYIPGLTHDNLVHHIRYVSVVNKGDFSTYIYYPPHDNSPSSPVPLFNTQWTTEVQKQRNPEDDYRVISFFTITDIN